MKIDGRYEIRVVVIELLPDGSTGDVYDDLSRFRADHPHGEYKFGFVVFDTATGFMPDDCNDWNDSPEEVLMDYTENCT